MIYSTRRWSHQVIWDHQYISWFNIADNFWISAIDNATRNLIAQDQLPVTCGLFFSLGHSTIVIAVVSSWCQIPSNTKNAPQKECCNRYQHVCVWPAWWCWYRRSNRWPSYQRKLLSSSWNCQHYHPLENNQEKTTGDGYIKPSFLPITIWYYHHRPKEVSSKINWIRECSWPGYWVLYYSSWTSLGRYNRSFRCQSFHDINNTNMCRCTVSNYYNILHPAGHPHSHSAVGVLFGLGLDTASSIALLAISALAERDANGHGIQPGEIVILPVSQNTDWLVNLELTKIFD